MKRWIGMILLVALFTLSGTVLADGIRSNGGSQISLLKLSYGNLNDVLQGYGFEPLSEWAVLWGGGGIGGMISGVRVGGYGAGGDITSLTGDGEKAALSMGFGGLVVENGVYHNGKTDIAVGAMIGGGGATLQLKRPLAGGVQKQEFSKGFLILEPRVNVHYQIVEWVGVELIASYMLTHDFDQKWSINNQTVTGPFHFNGGPQLALRVIFGF